MLRHLRRFTNAGWTVSVFSEWGQAKDSCTREGWPAHELPHRRGWWPPYRPDNPVLRATRMGLWAGECRRILNGERPDAILTYLSYHSELMSEVAAHYSRRSGVPMTTIIYDDALAFKEHEAGERKRIGGRFRWILRQSHQNWFVSSELAEAYGFAGGPDNVLMPMPEGTGERVEWRADFAERPVLVYAGYIYEQQFPLLARLGKVIDAAGGRFLILSRDTPGLRRMCTESGIELQPLLPTNQEALEFVGKNAAAFVAAYCDRVEEMPWIRSSFPSKVVEFGHLGLPIVFISPAESAVYLWGREGNLPYNLVPAEIDRVADFVMALKEPKQWNGLAEPIRKLAATEFSPELIQRRLMEGLM
jgi:glycosyltransferase involved in cell wall biosynthesis